MTRNNRLLDDMLAIAEFVSKHHEGDCERCYRFDLDEICEDNSKCPPCDCKICTISLKYLIVKEI